VRGKGGDGGGWCGWTTFFFSITRGMDRIDRQVERESGRHNSKGRRVYSQVQQRS
jgi:hypothetical protein